MGLFSSIFGKKKESHKNEERVQEQVTVEKMEAVQQEAKLKNEKTDFEKVDNCMKPLSTTRIEKLTREDYDIILGKKLAKNVLNSAQGKGLAHENAIRIGMSIWDDEMHEKASEIKKSTGNRAIYDYLQVIHQRNLVKIMQAYKMQPLLMEARLHVDEIRVPDFTSFINEYNGADMGLIKNYKFAYVQDPSILPSDDIAKACKKGDYALSRA